MIQSKSNVSFLSGGGELGELTRTYDWSATPVGTFDTWPPHLRSTVAMIISSKFPMFLWWGEDMIQFYNDAYRPSLGNQGKHPLALGQKAKDCWGEIWDIIYPLIRQVQTTGEATWNEDMLVPIYRNGKIEEVFWTFGYSPVRDDAGKIDGVLVVCTETTEKVKYLSALTESKNELEFAIEASELGTWDLDPLTNRFTANARLKDWFGLPASEQVLLPLALDVILPEDRNRVTDAISKALDCKSDGKYDIEYTIVHPHTGFHRIVRARGKAMFDNDGTCLRFNGTLQDITMQSKARTHIEQQVAERTQQLEIANRDLEKSNAALSQFAYIASHDLQEPLRKVSIYSQMLQEHLEADKDPKTEKYLSKVVNATNKSLALIRDVLAYSQITQAEEKYFTHINLNQLLTEIIDDFDLLITQKKAIVQVDALPGVQASPLQMSQLFSNLLSNALKFINTDKQPVIQINASIKNRSEIPVAELADGPYWDIIFTDNGIGFSKEYAEKIFNIFQRLHRSADYEGTGIGLALCKRIAQNHGGNMYAEAAPGKGATFHVLLPATIES